MIGRYWRICECSMITPRRDAEPGSRPRRCSARAATATRPWKRSNIPPIPQLVFALDSGGHIEVRSRFSSPLCERLPAICCFDFIR